MSLVTNYILHIPYGGMSWDGEEALVNAVNEGLVKEFELPRKAFAPAPFHRCYDAYGGTKCLEADIAIWALNYVHPTRFLPIVLSAAQSTKYPRLPKLQVFCLHQEDDRFFDHWPKFLENPDNFKYEVDWPDYD